MLIVVPVTVEPLDWSGDSELRCVARRRERDRACIGASDLRLVRAGEKAIQRMHARGNAGELRRTREWHISDCAAIDPER